MLVLLVPVLWAVAELFVTIKVADAIGAALTVLLLVASVPVGVWMLRREGRAAWQRLGSAVQAGRPPAREAIDGALGLAGGMLLIVPGFISDAIGLLLLCAPTRALARAGIARNFRSRIVVGATRFTRRPPGSYAADSTTTVDSTATDVNPPGLRP
jgi:UPF0716 protein FxsA